MKGRLLAGIILSLTVFTLAQAGLGQQGAPGPLPFNLQTLETVQGMVVEAPEIKGSGIPEMARLTLKTRQEQLTVVLGPNWFLAKQDWKITTLDRLEVTGSRLTLDGKPALLAQQVKKGEQVMKFRDQSGRPLWAPSRTRKQ